MIVRFLSADFTTYLHDYRLENWEGSECYNKPVHDKLCTVFKSLQGHTWDPSANIYLRTDDCSSLPNTWMQHHGFITSSHTHTNHLITLISPNHQNMAFPRPTVPMNACQRAVCMSTWQKIKSCSQQWHPILPNDASFMCKFRDPAAAPEALMVVSSPPLLRQGRSNMPMVRTVSQYISIKVWWVIDGTGFLTRWVNFAVEAAAN